MLPQKLFQSSTSSNPSNLFSWGLNTSGQLGLGDALNRSSPTLVGASSWRSISKSISSFTFAIKTNGTLWAWGTNSAGNLGIGTIDGALHNSPVQVGRDTNWSQVASGYYHSVGVKTDGTIWSWGYNTTAGGPYYTPSNPGGLGQNNVVNLFIPTQIGALTNWSAVAVGRYHSLALKTDGTVWSWGFQSNGELGLGDTNITRSSPTQIGTLTNWASIAAGFKMSFGIKTDGTLWAWGQNVTTAVLGLGNTINRSSPTQVGTLTNWSKVAAGVGHVLALKTDNTLWSWGINTTNGALGLGDKVNRNSPVQVGTLTTWSDIGAGSYNSLALKTDHTLWSWGLNSSGQLGQGNVVLLSSPVQVGTLAKWTGIGNSISSNFGSYRSNL